MRKLAAILCALLMLPLLAAPLPGAAAPYMDNAALDELFDQLRTARDEAQANQISGEIWEHWFRPNDPDLSRRMGYVRINLSSGEVPAALVELDAIVADYPDYAEGWNQRATLHFMRGELDASLADIEKVLALEPRHFGALAGRVLIYLQQGRTDEARAAMVAALAIHPYLSERRLFPELVQNVTRT